MAAPGPAPQPLASAALQKEAGEGSKAPVLQAPARALPTAPDPPACRASGRLDPAGGSCKQPPGGGSAWGAWPRAGALLGGAWVRRRRLAANARERRRMLGLNVAFDRLRSVVPALRGRRKLSKAETLQMAKIYIATLSELLQQAGRAGPGTPGQASPASGGQRSPPPPGRWTDPFSRIAAEQNAASLPPIQKGGSPGTRGAGDSLAEARVELNPGGGP